MIMRKIVVFFAIMAVMNGSCREQGTCDNSALYGYVNICLPKIKGMTECGAHPIVQQITQQYRTTGPVLGYYLTNEMYRNIYLYQPGKTAIEEYFMIYGNYLQENYNASENDLELMVRNLEQTLFEGTNFDQISSKVEDAYGKVTPGRPVLLEKYSPQPNVQTMILLIKAGEETVVSAVDCILIKKRLITLAYYITYRGGTSIDILKKKNNDAVKRLIEIN